MKRAWPAWLFFVACASAQVPDKEEIARVLATLSEITGFEVKRPVPGESMSREAWKDWLEAELKRRVKPEEIRAEELVLRKFGLAPAGFDLKQTTIDLLTEQAAAFYDHRKKKMVFVEGATGMGQSAVLGHELSHALADQHFPLGRFIDAPNKTDDGQTARMAVVEGQAMWLMIELPLRAMNMSLRTNPAPLEMAMRMTTAQGMFPVFEKVPLYIRETLLFPYREGALFQQKVVEKMGTEGFRAVLKDPPVSTQQVIHPERYFEKVMPTSPPLPPFERGKGWKRLTDGNLGELDLRLLLEQYAHDAEAARALAARLRGAQYDLWEDRAKSAAVLRWSAEWDSEEAAASFLAMYRQVMAGKWKKYSPSVETPDEITGAGDDGGFQIRRRGATVEALEGLPLY